jgi:hypothetical protein
MLDTWAPALSDVGLIGNVHSLDGDVGERDDPAVARVVGDHHPEALLRVGQTEREPAW